MHLTFLNSWDKQYYRVWQKSSPLKFSTIFPSLYKATFLPHPVDVNTEMKTMVVGVSEGFNPKDLSV